MGGGQGLVTSWGRIPDHKRCERASAGPRLGCTELGECEITESLGRVWLSKVSILRRHRSGLVSWADLGLGVSWPRCCLAASHLPHLFRLMTHVGVPRFCSLLVVQDSTCWTRPRCVALGSPCHWAGGPAVGVTACPCHRTWRWAARSTAVLGLRWGGRGPTPTRYPSSYFTSTLIFCAFFCLRISFSLTLGGSGSGWHGGGRWMSLPCTPMSGDVVMVIVYSGILQVNRLG